MSSQFGRDNVYLLCTVKDKPLAEYYEKEGNYREFTITLVKDMKKGKYMVNYPTYNGLTKIYILLQRKRRQQNATLDFHSDDRERVRRREGIHGSGQTHRGLLEEHQSGCSTPQRRQNIRVFRYPEDSSKEYQGRRG